MQAEEPHAFGTLRPTPDRQANNLSAAIAKHCINVCGLQLPANSTEDEISGAVLHLMTNGRAGEIPPGEPMLLLPPLEPYNDL
jgi:hypothetical protein